MDKNRRSFFGVALSSLGILSMAKVFRSETVWAAGAVKARAGGKAHAVFASEESLAGLPEGQWLNRSELLASGR